MNAEILETKGARILGFGIQIPELLAKRKFVDSKKFATPTLTPTILLKTSKNRKYKRGYLGNYQKQGTGILDLNSVISYGAQVCYANMPRPL